MSSWRMESGRAVVALALVLTWAPAVAVAQEEEAQESNVSFTPGARTWVTTGNTKMNFGFPPFINILSELRWRGVDSVVQEFNAEFVWKSLVVRSSVGTGGISQGVLIDDDFSENNRRGRFSHTRSSVTGDGLFYVNADVGLRLFVPTDEGTPQTRFGRRVYLDLFVGYQYWHEEYVAFGATSGFPDVVPPIGFNTKVITHDYFWHSVRVGERMQIPLYAGLGLKADAVVLPWSSSRLEDVHHLRDDLKKNPSFLSEAKGGFGVQLDGSLTYKIWKGLSVEAGYRYWRIDSGGGDTFARLPDVEIKEKLNKIIVERYGPYFGLQYRF